VNVRRVIAAAAATGIFAAAAAVGVAAPATAAGDEWVVNGDVVVADAGQTVAPLIVTPGHDLVLEGPFDYFFSQDQNLDISGYTEVDLVQDFGADGAVRVRIPSFSTDLLRRELTIEVPSTLPNSFWGSRPVTVEVAVRDPRMAQLMLAVAGEVSLSSVPAPSVAFDTSVGGKVTVGLPGISQWETEYTVRVTRTGGNVDDDITKVVPIDESDSAVVTGQPGDRIDVYLPGATAAIASYLFAAADDGGSAGGGEVPIGGGGEDGDGGGADGDGTGDGPGTVGDEDGAAADDEDSPGGVTPATNVPKAAALADTGVDSATPLLALIALAVLIAGAALAGGSRQARGRSRRRTTS
jgi:hypothetical protein